VSKTQKLHALTIKINAAEGARLPVYQTSGAAGADIYAFLSESVAIPTGQYLLIPTGLRMAIPKGFEVQIRPRSGLALQYGVTVLNSPGTIDSDYRGEVAVILINHGTEPFMVHNGDRIAQMIVSSVTRCVFEFDALDQTVRGAGGYGSTGIK